MNHSIIRIGAFLAMLGVISGAFGAHALKNRVDDYGLEIWNKAVLYQFIHAFALVATGILTYQFPEKKLKRAAVFFTIGIILFSGSLYILSFSKISALNLNWAGPLTPIGGLSFICGWIFLISAVWKNNSAKYPEQ